MTSLPNLHNQYSCKYNLLLIPTSPSWWVFNAKADQSLFVQSSKGAGPLLKLSVESYTLVTNVKCLHFGHQVKASQRKTCELFKQKVVKPLLCTAGLCLILDFWKFTITGVAVLPILSNSYFLILLSTLTHICGRSRNTLWLICIVMSC